MLLDSIPATFTHRIYTDDLGLHVEFHAQTDEYPVDVTHVFGYLCDDTPHERKLIDRLIRAVESGAAIKLVGRRTNISGGRFWATQTKVTGKYLNSDLKKLGY